MGGTTSNLTNMSTSITNSYLQQASNTCQVTTDSNTSGNTVIISGTVEGDVNIKSESQASASCSMSNNVSSISQTTISNAVKQNSYSETDFLGDLQWSKVKNTTNIYNGITNSFTQVTENACQATDSSTTSNNFVYVTTGGFIGGDINLTSSANANASCVMSNTSKAAAYQNIQNSADQVATHVGMVGAFMSILTSLVIIIAIVAVVMFTACETGSVFKTEAKCKSESGCYDHTVSDVAMAGIAAGSEAIQSGALDDLLASGQSDLS